MSRNAEVDRWLENHPKREVLQCVRDIVLGADPRITESVTDGTVQFGYLGGLASFVGLDGDGVTVRFDDGARLAGAFPRLEGGGDDRLLHFADLGAVRARANELRGVAVACCRLRSGGAEIPPSVRSLPKATKAKKKAVAKPKKAIAKPKKKVVAKPKKKAVAKPKKKAVAKPKKKTPAPKKKAPASKKKKR